MAFLLISLPFFRTWLTCLRRSLRHCSPRLDDGRRWVAGTFGDVNWVRNLHAAGRATLTVGRRTETVSAIELSPESGGAFFRDVLGPFVRGIPLGLGPWMLAVLGAKDILFDPTGSGATHPVFEVHAA